MFLYRSRSTISKPSQLSYLLYRFYSTTTIETTSTDNKFEQDLFFLLNKNEQVSKNEKVKECAKNLQLAYKEYEKGNYLNARKMYDTSVKELETQLQILSNPQFVKQKPTPAPSTFTKIFKGNSLQNNKHSNPLFNRVFTSPQDNFLIMAMEYNNLAEIMRYCLSNNLNSKTTTDTSTDSENFNYSFKDIVPLYTKSWEIWKAASKNVQDLFFDEISSVFNNLGVFYIEIAGNTSKAFSWYDRALSLRRDMIAKASTEEEKKKHQLFCATILNSMGEVHLRGGRTKEAEKSFSEAIQLYENQLSQVMQNNRLHMNYVNSINNFGTLFFATNSEKSLKYFQKALQCIDKYEKEMNTKAGYELGLTLFNIASVYFEKKQYKEAESFYRQALLNFEQNLPDDHKYLVITYTRLALTVKQLYERAMADNSDLETVVKPLKEENQMLLDKAREKAEKLKKKIDQIQKETGEKVEA